MITEETKKIIQDQFKILPPVIQDVILNSNWEEKIRKIVKINNLHVDQGAAIENLVFVTMLGMETPDDFVENAQEYAKVTEEQALAVSSEVERRIFREIREKLIEITETTDTVGDIDRVTDELGQVSMDIEKQVALENVDGYEKIKEEQGLPFIPKAEEEKPKNPINLKIFNKDRGIEEKISLSAKEKIDANPLPEISRTKISERRDEKLNSPNDRVQEESLTIRKEENNNIINLKPEREFEGRPSVSLGGTGIAQGKTFTPTPPVIPSLKKIVEIPKEASIISEKLGAPTVSKKGPIIIGDRKSKPNIEIKNPKGNYSSSDPYRENVD